MTPHADPAPSASPFLRLLRRVEESRRLDDLVRAVAPIATRIVARPPVRALLHGEATGTPLHVIFTDVPFGAWFMTIFLDLFPDAGIRRATNRLVALGIVAAVPTAVTGWAEWALADQGTRRVGLLHAGANAIGTGIFVGSWAARVSGRHELGVGLARAGGGVLIAGAMAGGYLRSDRPAVTA